MKTLNRKSQQANIEEAVTYTGISDTPIGGVDLRRDLRELRADLNNDALSGQWKLTDTPRGNIRSNKGKYIRLLSYFRPYTLQIILCIIMALLVIVTDLANPYIMKIAIDEYIVNRNTSINIELLGLLYLGAILVGAVLNYFQQYLLNSVGQRILHTIRMQVFSHIQKMPLSFFDRFSSGRILTRVTNDVEALNEVYSSVLVALFKDAFMLIGIVVVMLQLNWKMALISFVVIPIIAMISHWYNTKAKPNFRRVRALIAQINGFFAENISGMRLVQIFNRQKEKLEEFRKLNAEYNRASVLEVVLNAVFRPSAELVNSFATVLLIWYCTPKIFEGTLEIGLLYAFYTYSKKFFQPINDLADKYNTILSASVSADRIFEILDDNEGIEDLEKGEHVPAIKGKIEFKNVWFAYNDDNWVLKDVSFVINPGEKVAFVGATGSGKTTIISLMARFYEVQKGEILIDGVNIKNYRLDELRRSIAVVMQDVFLFSGDIASNIRLNNENISMEEVMRAAEYVNADSFIKNIPGGYRGEVKEKGCTLSAGQRQLLSFARAIAFNPAILVLDEATANIDTETELLIQDSLEKISRNRTTVVIAHRLSTIKNSDKIIVIHKGRIREMGTHEELLKKGGIYTTLYKMQYAS